MRRKRCSLYCLSDQRSPAHLYSVFLNLAGEVWRRATGMGWSETNTGTAVAWSLLQVLFDRDVSGKGKRVHVGGLDGR